MSKKKEIKGIVCIACSIFRFALGKLQKSEGFYLTVRYLPSMLHMKPEKLNSLLDNAIIEELDKGNKVILLYGDCHSHINKQENMPGVLRVHGINCPEILLAKEKFRALRKEGAFFLMPEWTKRWIEVFKEELGFSGQTAKDFMREMHTKLIYLDIEGIPAPVEKLKEVSEFTGLPWEILPTSLAPLFNEIKDAVRRLNEH